MFSQKMPQRRQKFRGMSMIALLDGGTDVVTQHIADRRDAGILVLHQPRGQRRGGGFGQVFMLGYGINLFAGQAAKRDAILDTDNGGVLRVVPKEVIASRKRPRCALTRVKQTAKV